LRLMRLVFLLLLLLLPSTSDFALPSDKAYRTIPGLDLRIFGCLGDPSYRLLSSEAELDKALGQQAKHCADSDLPPLKAHFLASLKPSGIRWKEESLVILQESYGTGMAKAHLELSSSQAGVVDASIVWRVPPPPLTPDVAVFTCAFAVKKAEVAEIRVRGLAPKPTVITVPR
jgi:hypothetical protein